MSSRKVASQQDPLLKSESKVLGESIVDGSPLTEDGASLAAALSMGQALSYPSERYFRLGLKNALRSSGLSLPFASTLWFLSRYQFKSFRSIPFPPILMVELRSSRCQSGCGGMI
ncbi:hypothetical protein VNO77_46806 [Canavalia gladiata]|uniref:Uncharacterized protein n=1 Tax=Canavalia gladiata TaxID=3824 RepID=A0AAN9JFK2_CANGL